MPSAIAIDDNDVLLAIDLQVDFMPGGALGVDEGDSIVPSVNALMRVFSHIVVTQDWHPPGHASFASTHGAEPFATKRLHYGEQTLWPDHCVQGTGGRGAPSGARARQGVPHPAQGHARRRRFLFGLRRGGRQDDDRAGGAPSRTRGPARLLLRPCDRLLRRLFRLRRARSRIRDLRHRGRLPGESTPTIRSPPLGRG